MKLKTDSGIVTGNKRERYMWWLKGRIESGAFTGQQTIKSCWDKQGWIAGQMDTYADAFRVGHFFGKQELRKELGCK